MLSRLLKLPHHQHFFLFGARGTGKSTLLQQQFEEKNTVFINLLDPEQEAHFARQPNDLLALVKSLPQECTHVVIDEIQKLPKLLDVVHFLIESKLPQRIILTRSSARKLRRGGANLLAGRAFVYALYPFSYLELGVRFKLEEALAYGNLPRLQELPTPEDKIKFLHSYANTYLKEEIWAEQFIKQLDPFRRFLEVAAQSNGKIINFSNIARDVGVSDHTVKDYFSILEDTLLGFFLEPFHHSFRKRLQRRPKFYFFDTGITRALSHSLRIPLQTQTYAYGEAFEHFIILECMKLASYYELDYRFSYLATKDDAEVDLVVERPGKKTLLIEIKSTTQVQPQHLKTLETLRKDMGDVEAACFSQDPFQKKYGDITVYPWHEGIKWAFASFF